MLFDAKTPKQRTGIRKYLPWPVIVILIIIAVVVLYIEFHNYPETHAVDHFLSELQQGNYQQAYKLWQPSPSYTYTDFMHDWGPQGDFGKIQSYRILDDESKGGEIVIVTVQINHRTPYLALTVDRKTKGLSYSPF